jgi:hypothetical protein
MVVLALLGKVIVDGEADPVGSRMKGEAVAVLVVGLLQYLLRQEPVDLALPLRLQELQ